MHKLSFSLRFILKKRGKVSSVLWYQTKPKATLFFTGTIREAEPGRNQTKIRALVVWLLLMEALWKAVFSEDLFVKLKKLNSTLAARIICFSSQLCLQELSAFILHTYIANQ